ncbi:MAG: hypothetical protein H6Q17_2309 [Bacteroidetes bacterium]|nr:hypothetical protein [Bacteroidota bacterium]
MIRIMFLLLAGMLSLPVSVFAQKNHAGYLRPDVVEIQYAGNYGLMSLGLGQEFCKDILSSYLVLGYLPKAVNGVEVKSLAVKNTIQMKQFDFRNNRLQLYTGVSVIYYKVHNTYTRFPKYFPKGYYDFPTSLHAAPLIGSSFLWNTTKNKLAFFWEFATLDYYLINYFKNRSMNFLNLWNLSFGMTLHFN